MTKLNNCLVKKDSSLIPVWFMRQAGRYLPEFREIRKKNSDFIKLCLNSDLASQITLQPIERFNLDAAIIFSDILMVPFGLGQNISFKEGKGPTLSNFDIDIFSKVNENEFSEKLSPIYKAISITRKKLKDSKSLICFVGAPWTLILYMFNSKESLNVLENNNLKTDLILNKLIKFLSIHIKNQFEAGADIVQIFDSWAGLLPDEKIEKYCYKPNSELVNFCNKINLPVICFPKGIKKKYLDFLLKVRPDGLNIDYDVDPNWARNNLKDVCIQGGMDPKILFEKDEIILSEVEKYLNIFNNSPYIFNLGHGVLPTTDPEKIKKIVDKVNSFKK